MKNKIILALLVCLAIFTLSACGAKKEIVGSWHMTEAAGGQSLSEYAESVGLNEILIATTLTFNDDGSFNAENGLSIAMGLEASSGTWEYSNGAYLITMSDGTQYQADLKDGKLTLITSDGITVFESGAANIDAEEAKRAYAALREDPEPDEPEDNTPKPSAPASPGAIEESEKPEEETPAPNISASEVYNNIIGKLWVDADGNYYDFYDDNTCYVKYKTGSELTGEYQFIDDNGKIIFDVILNESEQLRTLTDMDENSISFKDDAGNELKLTKTE